MHRTNHFTNICVVVMLDFGLETEVRVYCIETDRSRSPSFNHGETNTPVWPL